MITLIEKVLDNTTLFAIVVIILQSILLPRLKNNFPIYILPTIVFIGGEYMIWATNHSNNQILGTFVVIGLSILLIITGIVAKYEIRKSKQEKVSKSNFYSRK